MSAKNYKIKWSEVDVSILTMSPREKLNYYTRLAEEQRNNNYTWIVSITPASEEMDFFSISLSNNALYKFTDELIEVFAKLSTSILTNCSCGSCGYVAKQGLLSITVPKHLLEQTKSAICDVLEAVQHVVKDNEWQND